MISKEFRFGTKTYSVFQITKLRSYYRDNVKVHLAEQIVKLYDEKYTELIPIFTAVSESLGSMTETKTINTKTNSETFDENDVLNQLTSYNTGIRETIKTSKRFALNDKQKAKKIAALNIEKIFGDFSMTGGSKTERLGKVPNLIIILNKLKKEDIETLELTDIITEMKRIASLLTNTTFSKSNKKSDNLGIKPQASRILDADIRSFVNTFNNINVSLRGKYNFLASKIDEYVKTANSSKREDASDESNVK